ncbi:polysaccharide deacetylase family protein [Spongiactinospora sp. TRM90649]|uniref:polysaccharide deacetylase family protein n=1 Tax=Spongiactinospora sp. TRM90649 TaxID=3031114 RepID=UPI0023F6E6CF|nr:polysaccharide deacetylase family protein [Spongiactinospora sp. TRM90649]MDF5758544.1 polysaccharide deacetylase family protein [Spongiactinospora sp. TRM90649]
MGGFGVCRTGAAALSVLALAGCMSSGEDTAKVAAPKGAVKAVSPQEAKQAKAAAAAKVKANELGQVPVLMYHRVVPKPETSDDRTPAQFRAELERLASEDYVPITAAEYATGKIGIPAGKHPVVLTFDDSSPSQVTLDGMGVPAPDTALGILLDVAAKKPGFRPVATFYVTGDMFGKERPDEQTQIMTWLHEHGFDLGNHTRDHLNLRGKSKEQVNKEIAAGHQVVKGRIPFDPVTLALPYGNQPNTKAWALRGAANGTRYSYGGVFLAGYTPAASPFSTDFDPMGIPRIKSQEKKGDCVKFCSTAWLDWLKAHPDERFTSDGDIRTVAYPKFKAAFGAKRYSAYALSY